MLVSSHPPKSGKFPLPRRYRYRLLSQIQYQELTSNEFFRKQSGESDRKILDQYFTAPIAGEIQSVSRASHTAPNSFAGFLYTLLSSQPLHLIELLLRSIKEMFRNIF